MLAARDFLPFFAFPSAFALRPPPPRIGVDGAGVEAWNGFCAGGELMVVSVQVKFDHVHIYREHPNDKSGRKTTNSKTPRYKYDYKQQSR